MLEAHKYEPNYVRHEIDFYLYVLILQDARKVIFYLKCLIKIKSNVILAF